LFIYISLPPIDFEGMKGATVKGWLGLASFSVAFKQKGGAVKMKGDLS
jgi:hypothetical protein